MLGKRLIDTSEPQPISHDIVGIYVLIQKIGGSSGAYICGTPQWEPYSGTDIWENITGGGLCDAPANLTQFSKNAITNTTARQRLAIGGYSNGGSPTLISGIRVKEAGFSFSNVSFSLNGYTVQTNTSSEITLKYTSAPFGGLPTAYIYFDYN